LNVSQITRWGLIAVAVVAGLYVALVVVTHMPGLLLLLLVAVALYFVPTGVAMGRRVSNVGGVAIVNLLLGWSVVGWGAALVMACVGSAVSKEGQPA
jgi:hypothetical protein